MTIRDHTLGGPEEARARERGLVGATWYQAPLDRRAVTVSRVHLLIHGAVWATALATASWLPVVLVGLPRCYGIRLSFVMGVPQRLGLDEDVLDHRLNSRTILVGPVLRFFTSNMNYHVEHHMVPMVPWHRLPDIHEAIRHDCPAPYPSLWAAWAEIAPTVIRRMRDPAHVALRPLPPGAGEASA